MWRKWDWSSKLLSKLSKATKQIKTLSGKPASPELSKLQKNIYRQAALAGMTIVLTVVILFAMTSAWYTNIVQTSGLVFKAEPWGFDGTITVSEDPIQAAPGDDGIVSLRVQNTSESISAISVNMSKAGMETEMQKRLFFYVDAHMTRENEVMDRVYINNYEGYTYTVFGNGMLTLTEQLSNAPQLKWEWVYDVLGYYVMAHPIRDENNNITRMNIQDYLRPIEYNFDDATTRFDTDSQGNQIVEILTVDGKTTLDEYLVLQSMKDGYPGNINVHKDLVYSYGDKAYFYKVDVDDQGNGVYAYVCSYSDVEAATQWDTELGELAYRNIKTGDLTAEELKRLSYEATLNISAQRSESSVVSVSTLSALNTAIEEGYADVIQLSADVNIPANDPLEIPKNTRAVIDLNNFTLSADNTSGAAIYARQGSSLTLINGTLTGAATSSGSVRCFETTGAEVIMSNVKLSGFDYGFYMADHLVVDNKANELDSRVHLMNCDIKANWYGVYIVGNGNGSAQKTQLIVEKSTIVGDGYAITGNGTTTGNGRWGTDIQILDSVIKQNETAGGTGAAIYQPQKNSSLTISNSTVSGYTGIALKGGTANIIDTTVTGWGNPPVAPSFGGSGFSDTADAVYIETNYGYEIRLDISGNTELISKHGKSLQVYESDAENVFVQILSGTFDQYQPAQYVAKGSTQAAKDGKYVITAP